VDSSETSWGLIIYKKVEKRYDKEIWSSRKKANKGGNYIFNFIEKWDPNRPKADKGLFYVENLLKNEPQIGWSYILNWILLKNKTQIGGRPIKGEIIQGVRFFPSFFQIG
jgi:hypothetical protein